MNLYSRLFLVSCLLTSIMYGQQRFFLDDSHMVVRDSAGVISNFEHSLFDYHHYYLNPSCDRKWFDVEAVPFYTHLKSIETDAAKTAYPDDKTGAKTQFGGALFQAQLNICDFYIRANTMVANVKSSFESVYGDQYKDLEKYSFTGVDDVTLKLGYDWFFCNDDHHAGLYMLGGFPVNNVDVATTPAELATQTYTDRLGVYSYRVGAGVNTAFTLYTCDNDRLTWHADVQYAYAFPKTVLETKLAGYPEGIKTKYTPGQFVNGWTALHYAFCNWGVELGSSFGTMFDEKFFVDTDSKKTEEAKLGRTVSFFAQPYFAAAYNTTICENPFTVGLGIGYEYDKMHDLPNNNEVRKYDAFQGVNVWGNLTYSF